jgi:hypothetical protein
MLAEVPPCSRSIKFFKVIALAYRVRAERVGVRYQDGLGRTIANDDDPSRVLGAFTELYRVLGAFTELYRVLKLNSVRASFY